MRFVYVEFAVLFKNSVATCSGVVGAGECLGLGVSFWHMQFYTNILVYPANLVMFRKPMLSTVIEFFDSVRMRFWFVVVWLFNFEEATLCLPLGRFRS